MHLRPLLDNDIPAVISIFRDAIFHIASRDYAADQLRAWVQHVDDREAFRAHMQQGLSLIAEDHLGAVAFGQLHPADHLNYLYCRPRGQGKGHAAHILRALEEKARRHGIHVLSTEASLTARRFFEKHDYRVIEAEIVVRQGIQLRRFKMQKLLRDGGVSATSPLQGEPTDAPDAFLRTRLTVRPFQSTDLEHVIHLWYETWHHTFPGMTHPHPADEWKRRFQRDFSDRASIWVAESSGVIAGFMVVMPVENSLEQIFVDRDFQGQGIGTLLVSKAKSLCPHGMRLHTLQQNTAAGRFYEKLGFRPTSVGVNRINGQPNIEYIWIPSRPC